jgi:hypothetical protein
LTAFAALPLPDTGGPSLAFFAPCRSAFDFFFSGRAPGVASFSGRVASEAFIGVAGSTRIAGVAPSAACWLFDGDSSTPLDDFSPSGGRCAGL